MTIIFLKENVLLNLLITIRSPALNMGTREEQLNLKPGLCSIAKKIREIVKKRRRQRLVPNMV